MLAIDHLCDFVPVAYIERVRVTAYFRGDGGGSLGIAIEDGDGCTLGREAPRRRRADTRSATGN